MTSDGSLACRLPQLASLRIVSAAEESALLPAMPDEELTIKNAVLKRQREFRAGRNSARVALQQLGLAGGISIPVGAHRQPMWPEGITGSISHTEGLCLAVCARTPHYLSVGIDAEINRPLPENVASQVLTPAEQQTLQLHPELPNTLIFSAKEAIFKAAYPHVNQYFEFQQATLTLDDHQQTFTATLCQPLADRLPHPCRWQGHYRVNQSHIVTLACLVKA